MPDWLIQIAGYLVAGGMAYGAIRQDLQHLHEKSKDLKASAEHAHRRLDDHIEHSHVRGAR